MIKDVFNSLMNDKVRTFFAGSHLQLHQCLFFCFLQLR